MHPSFADRFFAHNGHRQVALPHLVKTSLRVSLGVAALAAASKCQLPFWGTPVPFTMGPQMALLLAALLGHRQGVAVVMAWLALGVMGAPVFASGLTGWAALLGPTAGYALGYVPAAWWVGRFGQKPTLVSAGAWLGASALILAVGASGIGLWVGPTFMWSAGVAPFVVTDCCKALLAFAFFCLIRQSRSRFSA
jgi:biotin transport system substrate-specific component